MWRSTNTLVLGSGGLLGSQVVRALAGAVIAHTKPRFCAPQEVWRYLDEVSPTAVINCIGYLGADPCEHFRTNGCLPRVVADWCEGRALFIHISTNAVFPADTERVWLPGDAIAPRTAYEISKAFGEDPRAYVLRASFLGRSQLGRGLFERLRAGKPYRDAPFNGVTAGELAARISELVQESDARPRAGLEHVHSPAPIRISQLARLMGSSSHCEGIAGNVRLLGGGRGRRSLEAQLEEYLGQ